MTMIISDGKYLIADKREFYTAKGTRATMRAHADNCSKIDLVKPGRLKYGDTYVRAMAAAGSANLYTVLAETLLYIGDVVMTGQVLDLIYKLPAADLTRTSLYMLVDDGSTLALTLSDRGEVALKHHTKPICAWYKYQEFDMLDYPERTLDTFLISCANDPHCSTAYDVYSLEEDKLVENCVPSNADVEAACERWRRNLIVYPGHKAYADPTAYPFVSK